MWGYTDQKSYVSDRLLFLYFSDNPILGLFRSTSFISQQFNAIDAENLLFQQDGAIAHTSCQTMVLLAEAFYVTHKFA